MQVRSKILLTTLVLGAVALMLTPNAPLGSLVWSMPDGGPDPNAIQLGLFMVYTAIVSLAFGFGVAYWSFGWGWTRQMFPRRTVAAHVALGYVPASFWLHDNLHLVNGMNVNGLIAIEYLFHVPMILVGALLILATVQGVQAARDVPAYAT